MLKYWFSARPEAMPDYIIELFVTIVAVLIALTVLFAILKFRSKKSIYNKIVRSFYNLFLTNAIVGIFLLFFSFEQIPFLSSRFWLIIWLITNLVWLVFIGKRFLVLPKIKTEREKEKEYKKYIP